MFAWATPDYMLQRMTMQQIFMYYEYGMEHEENKANILTNRIAVGLFGAKDKPKKAKVTDDKPDREAFKKAYGDRIKRPEGGGA